jgi:hypothetical protein
MLAVFVLIFPAILAVIATVVILLAVRAVLAKRYGQFSNQQVKVQVILLILTVAEATPEQVIFDKAEEAATAVELEREYDSISTRIESLKAQSKAIAEKPETGKILDQIKRLESRQEALAAVIESKDAEVETSNEDSTEAPSSRN